MTDNFDTLAAFQKLLDECEAHGVTPAEMGAAAFKVLDGWAFEAKREFVLAVMDLLGFEG